MSQFIEAFIYTKSDCIRFDSKKELEKFLKSNGAKEINSFVYSERMTKEEYAAKR